MAAIKAPFHPVSKCRKLNPRVNASVLAAVVACVTYVHICPRQDNELIFRVFVVTLQICYWGLSDGMAWLANHVVNRIQENKK